MDWTGGVRLTGDYSKDITLNRRELIYSSDSFKDRDTEWKLTITINTTTTGYDVEFSKGTELPSDGSNLLTFYFNPWFEIHVHFTLAKLVQKLAKIAASMPSASFKDMEKEVTKFMVDVKNKRFNSHNEAVQFINGIMISTLARIKLDSIKSEDSKGNLTQDFFDDLVDLRFSKATIVVPGSLGYSLGRTFKLDDKIHIVIHYKSIENMCAKYNITDKNEVNGYIYTILVHEYIHAYQLLMDQATDENEAKIGMTIAAREFKVLTNETLIWAIENLMKEDMIDG